MTSQLNVDTIVDKAGSGGTNVKIANNAIAVAEGGSATTNVVQGLVKAWADIDGSSDAFRDSFNASSMTDNGSADYSMQVTNSLSNGNYSMHQCGGYSGNSGYCSMVYGKTSGEAEWRSVYSNNSLYEFTYQLVGIYGDLA